MPGQESVPAVPAPPVPRAEDDRPSEWRPLFLLAIIWIAFVSIIFTVVFMVVYLALNNAIWFENDFVLANRWTIPVGVIAFSVIVGLCQKYLRAPNVIHGSLVESLQEGKLEGDYRAFPGTVISCLASLLSGASVGPEGTLSILIGQISTWVQEWWKARESETMRTGVDLAALSSAFNGIIGSPFFTGIFATEYQIGKKNAATFMIWNLVAGLVGYLVYISLGLASFAGMIPFPPLEKMTVAMVIYAILLGGVGTLLALFAGISMKGIGSIMEKTFGERIMARILAAGAIVAIVGYFLPALLFSGEIQIYDVLANPAGIGVAMLLLYAVLKILLLALSFKSGYIGGPIFPVLFSSTMVGLALSLLFPGVPVAIFVLCIESATFAIALGAPLSAILLVIVIAGPNTNLITLVVISATTALTIGALLKQVKSRRAPATPVPVAAGPA
ncbi:MAG: chloride channel protein [Methanomicrobiales archaeon]|nr:chloride channel protein [Methanomicrobiales archaeon]MDD1669973.1 chloride channel protein [Methanomicrobiales archaeon]